MIKKYPDYTENYDCGKTFVENLHDCIKLRGYKYDRDYIEVDLGEYIAFCPFKFEILKNFRGLSMHCVCREECYWRQYFETEHYWWGDLKVFFFRKDTISSSVSRDKVWEFTCWMSVRQRDIRQRRDYMKVNCGDNFHHLHNNDNSCDQETLEFCTPIIESNYDKIVGAFMKTRRYKRLKPSRL